MLCIETAMSFHFPFVKLLYKDLKSYTKSHFQTIPFKVGQKIQGFISAGHQYMDACKFARMPHSATSRNKE